MDAQSGDALGRPVSAPSRPAAPPAFHRPVRPDWWLSGRYRSPSTQGTRAYLLFMLRELSSVVVALFLVFYLVQIARLSSGQGAYDAFVATLRSPVVVLLHLIALASAIYHAVTWWQLNGVVMVVRLGGSTVPPRQLVLGGYVLWAIASIAVCLILVGF